MPGFGPAADPLLFRQKWAKPCWPCCSPLPPQGQALRVPCAVHRPRRRTNSLRSNNARLFPGVGCTARPQHKARGGCRNNDSLITENQLAETAVRFIEELKQVRQGARFGQGLSRTQGRESLQRRHSRRLLAGIHLFFLCVVHTYLPCHGKRCLLVHMQVQYIWGSYHECK